ncbi:hypothetical protein BDV29DRAFT_184737 [Aspergillus leporis]|uniref:Uncharacterized protein n=1 Tax=Aspergillus leporis TaxID=41062 RepID=A0A5N5WIK6_9EURO|nr:hypothetical protein BDV29DRAFT_184737 [Aspergillus leporis]
MFLEFFCHFRVLTEPTKHWSLSAHTHTNRPTLTHTHTHMGKCPFFPLVPNIR